MNDQQGRGTEHYYEKIIKFEEHFFKQFVVLEKRKKNFKRRASERNLEIHIRQLKKKQWSSGSPSLLILLSLQSSNLPSLPTQTPWRRRGECNKMRAIHPQSSVCTLRARTVIHTLTEEWQLTPPIFISPPVKQPGQWEMLTEMTFPDDEIVVGDAQAFCRVVYWSNALRLCVRGLNSPSGGWLTNCGFSLGEGIRRLRHF